MKRSKSTHFLNISLVMMLLLTSLVIYMKFFHEKEKGGDFAINNIERISCVDLMGNELQLNDVIMTNEIHYILILEINNCNSCIFKGINDLTALQKEGKSCFVLVVHDLVDEIVGWSGQIDFTPFYMVKRAVFYDNFSTPLLPVLVKVKNGKVARPYPKSK